MNLATPELSVHKSVESSYGSNIVELNSICKIYFLWLRRSLENGKYVCYEHDTNRKNALVWCVVVGNRHGSIKENWRFGGKRMQLNILLWGTRQHWFIHIGYTYV